MNEGCGEAQGGAECCDAYECRDGKCEWPLGTLCELDSDKCCFGPPDAVWETDTGVTVKPLVGPTRVLSVRP